MDLSGPGATLQTRSSSENSATSHVVVGHRARAWKGIWEKSGEGLVLAGVGHPSRKLGANPAEY